MGSHRAGGAPLTLAPQLRPVTARGIIPAGHVTDERLFLDNRGLIDGIISLICRRNRLSPADADDFRSLALLKLVDKQYDVLRRFEGRSALRTYLTAVLQRTFFDFRTSQWGKWRPSVEARRLGPLAVRLEQLTTRDGLSLGEAIEVLRTSQGAAVASETLRAIADRLPPRISRKPQSEETLADVADPGPRPDDLVSRRELRVAAGRAHEALDRATAGLQPEDRLIIQLRFRDGMSIVDIARALALEPKPLYRRIEQILDRLRRQLGGLGVTDEVAGDLLDESWSDLVDPAS